MTYLVTNEKGRREFESILEAEDFIKQSMHSRVYEVDGFGNLTKLSEDEITVKIRNEKNSKEAEMPPQTENQEAKAEISPEQRREERKEGHPELEAEPKNNETNPIIKYALIAIALIIVAAVIILMIVPMFRQLMSVYSSV